MDADRKTRTRLIAVVLLAIGAACSAPPPVVQDAAAPQRIVSLVPAITETLFAIGAGPRVVGVGSFDTYPPEVRGLPRVGGLIDPDTERILSLRPDLVFVYGSQADLMAQLQRARIPVDTYRHAGLAGILASIRDVGSRVGLANEAQRVASDIEGALAEIRARHASRRRPATLVVFGREEGTLRGIYASGGTGFIHDMLEAAGGRNVFADVPRESVQASLESILARAPEVIVEVRAPAVSSGADWTAAQVQAWQRAASLPAVRTGRVHVLLDERLVVPGPRVADGVRLIADALHRQ